jgi:hypothetical protein
MRIFERKRIFKFQNLTKTKQMHPILKKLQLKEQKQVDVLNCPETLNDLFVEFSKDVRVVHASIKANAEFILGFATTLKQVEELAQLSDKLATDGLLWIAYPKGTSKRFKCEFNRDTGWESIGEKGFEPVRQIAIDEDWSALRFRKVEHIKKMTRSFALTEQGKKKVEK